MQCIGGYPTKIVTVYRVGGKTFALVTFNSFLANTHFETFSAYRPQEIKLIKQIGKKIQEATRKKISTFFACKVSQWQHK